MKYKLINRTTGEETLCDKVTIDGFDYYVSDEKSLSNNSDWYFGYPDYNTLFKWEMSGIHKGKQVWINKVIATNNPNLDIPKVVDEVEVLSNIEYPFAFGGIGNLENISKNHFIKGYNKSQETHPFSEEDMIEFGEWKDYNFYQHIEDNLYRTMQARPMYKVLENKSYTTKELLQLWKEQKPKTVYYE